MDADSVEKTRSNAGYRRRRLTGRVLTLATGILIVAVTATLIVMNAGEKPYSPEDALDLRLRSGRGERADLAGGTNIALRVAVAPVISPEAGMGPYQELISYLADRVDRRPVFLQGKNYSQVNDLIRMRQCDVAIVCTYSYVLAEEEFGARLLVIPQIKGQRSYHSFIVVPADSTASSLSDLRDKRFASCDVLSTSGWLYPMTRLKEQGFDASRFFSEHIISGSHDGSVFAVKSGIADGAAVDSVVFDQLLASNPELRKQVKVIHRSPPFGMPPFIVPSDLPQDLFDELQQIMLDMHKDAGGKEILGSLGFDKFLLTDQEAYESVRELHRSWHSDK